MNSQHNKVPDRLAALQNQFAGHIRNPDQAAPPEGIEDRRMGIYRDLFFNNIQKFLASNFPVLRKLYGKQDWLTLVREFFTEHRCHTPLFPELPREFLRYIQEQRQDREGDPAFMLELAHYEWAELAVSMDEHEIEAVDADPDGDLLDGIPAPSPVAWALSYQYPVHKIKPEYQPQEPPEQPTHIMVYRDRDDKVKFMQLNVLTLLLWQQLQSEEPLTGRQALLAIADTLNHPQPETVVEQGYKLLQDLLSKDIILGTYRR